MFGRIQKDNSSNIWLHHSRQFSQKKGKKNVEKRKKGTCKYIYISLRTP